MGFHERFSPFEALLFLRGTEFCPAAPAVDLPLNGDGNKQFISSRVNTRSPGARLAYLPEPLVFGFGAVFSKEPAIAPHRARASFAAKALSAKRKGLQLALEPLNGRGIAGYVPKP